MTTDPQDAQEPGSAAVDHLRDAWSELTDPGGAFELVDTTVRGVPMRVFASAQPDMRSVWELSALQGDKPYLVFEDERYTYADIHAQVRALAHHLVGLGVGRGDRVAV